MKVIDGVRRFAAPAIPAVAAAALEIGGYQDTRIANILWLITAVLLVLMIITWAPVRSFIRSLTKPVTSSVPLRITLGRQTASSDEREDENRPYTIHLGVRWEDHGDFNTGVMRVAGPFCPAHFTPLRKKTDHGSDALAEGTFVQEYPGRQAVCVEDGALYGLGRLGKTIEEARSEARAILVGMRRRGQSERKEPTK